MSDNLKEREAFEEWIERELNYGYNLTRDAEGNYPHDATDTAWLAWQGRAALAEAVQSLPASTGWVARKDWYSVPVLFNPYNGEPRDARDIHSDPQGILIAVPGAYMAPASPAQPKD